MSLIHELLITNESYSFKEDDNYGKVLTNLSKVNLFIGTNNSGKSRFLRYLFSNELNFKFKTDEISHINNILSYLKENNPIRDDFQEINGLYCGDKYDPIHFLKTNSYLDVYEILAVLEKVLNDSLRIIHRKEVNEDYKDINIYIDYRDYSNSMLSTYRNALKDINLIYHFKNCYIPILRGLRPISFNDKEYQENQYIDENDVYTKRTIHDYFSKWDNAPELDDINYIFSGLRTYEYFRDYKANEDDQKRKAITEYEKFLSDNFFNQQEVEIVPINPNDENKKRNVVKIKIGDEEGKMIYELGDGIQSIIIMTFPLFLYKGMIKENENVLVFLEEPELHMHPGLQRKIIQTFVNYEGFENFQFFITTHSTHFLDVSVDFNNISVYSFNKTLNEDHKPHFLIENRSINEPEILELLGTRRISAFSNCMIFIEGFTDRIFLKKYFEIYQNGKIKTGNMEFHEDYHYSFFEYNGSDIANSFLLKDEHYSNNILRLKNSVFVLIDGDKTNDKNTKELKLKLGDSAYILCCKEIENLVSKKILKRYLIEKKGYQESELNDFKEEDYQKIGCKLEDFINQIVLKTDSNPFKLNKKYFCQDITRLMGEKDDFSILAMELCDEIYDFIEKQNEN